MYPLFLGADRRKGGRPWYKNGGILVELGAAGGRLGLPDQNLYELSRGELTRTAWRRFRP